MFDDQVERAQRISQAIEECRSRCSHAGSPAAALSEFMLELRRERSWPMEDVLLVGAEAVGQFRDMKGTLDLYA